MLIHRRGQGGLLIPLSWRGQGASLIPHVREPSQVLCRTPPGGYYTPGRSVRVLCRTPPGGYYSPRRWRGQGGMLIPLSWRGQGASLIPHVVAWSGWLVDPALIERTGCKLDPARQGCVVPLWGDTMPSCVVSYPGGGILYAARSAGRERALAPVCCAQPGVVSYLGGGILYALSGSVPWPTLPLPGSQLSPG